MHGVKLVAREWDENDMRAAPRQKHSAHSGLCQVLVTAVAAHRKLYYTSTAKLYTSTEQHRRCNTLQRVCNSALQHEAIRCNTFHDLCHQAVSGRTM